MTVIISDSITPLGLSSEEASGSGQFTNVNLSYELLGERIEFWADDEIGLFYVYFPAPNPTDVYTSIKIIDTSDDSVVDQLILPYSTTTNRFSFEVDIDAMSFGDYSAEVTVLNTHIIAEGGLLLGGEATCQVSHYSYQGDGNLVLGGEAALAATAHHTVAEGGMTLGGEAEAYNSYYVYEAEGGVVTGGVGDGRISGLFTPEPIGGLTLGGSANASFTEDNAADPLPVSDSFAAQRNACQREGDWWCSKKVLCLNQNVTYNDGLIPAITVCNSEREVIRITQNQP